MINKNLVNYLPLLGVFLLAGCSDENEDPYARQYERDDQLIQSYIETNQLDVEYDASGFYYTLNLLKLKASNQKS